MGDEALDIGEGDGRGVFLGLEGELRAWFQCCARFLQLVGEELDYLCSWSVDVRCLGRHWREQADIAVGLLIVGGEETR